MTTPNRNTRWAPASSRSSTQVSRMVSSTPARAGCGRSTYTSALVSSRSGWPSQMPRIDPHDPGVEPARKRAEEAGDAARSPLKVGKGEARFGTASWTDPTMTAPGVFYPKGADTAEERLRFYASQFPVVEVDATYYALPNKRTAESWVERTPKGFVFDIKAHALMTGQPTELNRLPKAIKESILPEHRDKQRLYPSHLPAEAVEEIWRRFHEALLPLDSAGKLGAVLLQFPEWHVPS